MEHDSLRRFPQLDVHWVELAVPRPWPAAPPVPPYISQKNRRSSLLQVCHLLPLGCPSPAVVTVLPWLPPLVGHV